MDTVGPWELLVVLVVLVVLFGSNRLPRMARSVGEGLREFRAALRDSDQQAMAEPPPAAPPSPGEGPGT